MELSEKIYKLRKERGLTQEQFAERLFVSRTAVSKWETGRGTPGMESLRMIAAVCGVTLDQLLGAEEIIRAAENENRESIKSFACCVDGVFNLSSLLALILPLYKLELDGVFYSVGLCQLKSWLAFSYWVFPIAMALCGAIQLLIGRSEREKLRSSVSLIGSAFNIAAVFLLILSGQPYPAVMYFALLLIKGAVMLLKRK